MNIGFKCLSRIVKVKLCQSDISYREKKIIVDMYVQQVIFWSHNWTPKWYVYIRYVPDFEYDIWESTNNAMETDFSSTWSCSQLFGEKR